MKILVLLAILISSLTSGKTAPSEAYLAGEWGCTGNRFVFMAGEGPTPDKKDTDARLDAMGASRHNCTLTFKPGHKGTLRLGDNAIDFDWSLDNRTMEFKTSVGIISIKGYLVQENGKLILAYKRPDLFMIMQYLCTPQGRKNIAPLGKLLDSTKGLTLAMEFEKN